MRPARHDFEAIGTCWTIETAEPLPAETIDRIHRRIDDFDSAYSRFRPDSLISRLGENGGTCQLPDDAVPLFSFYQRLYRITGGKVSPLVGHALEHLGYDATYSLRRRLGPATVPAWDDVLTVDGCLLTASRPVLLDLGAAGKGYLVELLGELLVAEGIAEYLIDGSGDITRRGTDPIRIGLEHPDDPTKCIGLANLGDGALCGSALNRRSWGEGLHHIVDPSTGEPSTGVIATWVVADSAMIADGLATALFLTEPQILSQHYSFSYVRVLSDGGAEYSTNFDGELFR